METPDFQPALPQRIAILDIHPQAILQVLDMHRILDFHHQAILQTMDSHQIHFPIRTMATPMEELFWKQFNHERKGQHLLKKWLVVR